MKQKELDVVLLRDGREVTVLEVLGDGDEFYVECDMPAQDDCEWFFVSQDKIEKIIWSSKG